MLQDTLSNIGTLMRNNDILTEKKIDKLLNFLKYFNRNEYIYPGALISKLYVNADIAYNVLRILENNNIVSKSFEFYCRECNEFKGEIYDSFADIPSKVICRQCSENLDPIEDTIVIYRILVN